jgi:hypothetical protein
MKRRITSRWTVQVQNEKIGNGSCEKDDSESGRSLGGGQIAAVLLMDIKGVFPSVTKRNLIKRIDNMGFEADVCRWVECTMSDRTATIMMDGTEGESIRVQLGVPQGLPVSPILFTFIYQTCFYTVNHRHPGGSTKRKSRWLQY